MEEERGWEFMDKLFRHVREFLDSILFRFSPLHILSLHRAIGDNFLLIVSSADPLKPVTDAQLAHVATQLEQSLNEFLAERLGPALLPFGRMFHGHSLLEYNSNVRFERLVSRSINQAFQDAVGQEQRVFQMQVRQLQEIVNGNQYPYILPADFPFGKSR